LDSLERGENQKAPATRGAVTFSTPGYPANEPQFSSGRASIHNRRNTLKYRISGSKSPGGRSSFL